MSEGERVAELERRLEELRRVNEGLGRELVAANAGRNPRSAASAARSVARLNNERDAALEELELVSAELERLRGEREYLLGENARLTEEANRLRAGYLGLLRRALARARRR